MNLRPKTKRRLLVLIVGACLLGGGLTVFVTVQLRRHDALQLQYRAQAMDAYQRGDYTAAMDGFKLYLNNNSTDADAIYAYAVSRSRVPRSDLSHLLEAKSIFSRYLELRPGDAAAQHQLLETYQKLRFHAEALSLADTLLKRDPRDVPALKAKLHALIGVSKNEDALSVSEKINDVAPLDLDEQKTTYALMRQMKRPPEAIVARADGMLKVHPEDPRFELLRAVAASFVGDSDGAKKWVLTAATRTPPDAAFVRELSAVFDRIGMYDQARALLEKAALNDKTDPQLTTALIQRQWESGQFRDVLDRLHDVLPTDPNADPRLLAFKALSLYYLDELPHSATRPSTGDRATADAIVDALSRRTTDTLAIAWSSVLKARFTQPAMDPRQAVKLYQGALQRDRDNAVACYFLGLSYRELGETELARQAWQQASAYAPAWTDPHVMRARELLDAGRVEEAAGEAQIAALRSPNSPAVNTTLAVIAYNQLDPKPEPAKLDRLLKFVREIQTAAPNEPQTLPVYVALLMRAGQRDDAAAAIRAALTAQPPLPSDSLLKLAQISALSHLGVENAIASSLTDDRSNTPETALHRAMILAIAGKPVDGLKFITTVRDSAGADAPQWQLAAVKYRDAIGDPGVTDTWASLADANPKNLAIQQSVLAAHSAWTDRALIDRTIDRLKTLTGDEGIEWRLARARWKLNASDDTRNNASAAANMMSDVVRVAPNLPEPLVIWAQALERLGDFSGAIDRLRTATGLAHGDLNISMGLATLLQRHGNRAEAKEMLEQLAQSPAIGVQGRVQIARMLSAQGEYNDAISVLTGNGTADGVDPDRDLLLAQLLQAQGKTDDAAKLYDGLLQSPLANEVIVRAVAWFYASRQDSTKAREILNRLEKLKLPPGDRELTLAAFDEQFGAKPEAALEQYQLATQAAPSNPLTWQALAGFHLRRRDFVASLTTADQALKAFPSDPQLTALQSGARTLASLKAGSELQSLINAFSTNPTDEAASQTLSALSLAQTKQDPTAAALARLRDVADLHPKFLPVQMLLSERYFAAGRFEEADQIATRAMQAMPTEAEPARVLAVIAASAGHWDRVLVAAGEWRNRSLDKPRNPDEQIADAKLHLNDSAGAIRQISPYLSNAQANPDTMPQIIRLYAQALAQSNRPVEAQATLEPLIQRSPLWRAAWLEIGTTTARDAASATAWIDHVVPLTAPDSLAEKLRLGTAWYNVGQRFNDTASLTKARDLLKPLADTPAPPAGIWLLLGSVTQQLNDLPTAETAYRKALSIDPSGTMAQNNLAYAILLRNGDLTEAKALAEKAVTAAPNNSAFQDTLARIYARIGNLDAALTTFQNAVRADAGNIEALIGLADTQARIGRHDKAAVTLDQIDLLLHTNPTLTDPIRQQLEQVRAAIKKAAEATSANVK